MKNNELNFFLIKYLAKYQLNSSKMGTMKKFFKYLLFIITALVIAVIVFIKLFDFNDYKPQIEKLIHKYADVNVKINGDLSVAISWWPTIEVNDVVVTLPDGEKLADISYAQMEFSVQALLHKELEIDTLEASETEIFYNENESFTIHALEIEMDEPTDPLEVKIATTISGIAIDAKGTISSWKDLQQNDFNKVDIDAKFRALGYRMQFKGALNNLFDKMSAIGTYDLAYKGNKINGSLEINLAEETPYIKLNANGDKIDVASFKQTACNHLNWLISSAYAEEYIWGTTTPYSYLEKVNADISLNLKKVIVGKNLALDNIISDISLKNGKLKVDIKQLEAMNMKINGNLNLDSPKTLPYVKLNIQGNTLNLQKLIPSSAPKKIGFLNMNWLVGEAYAASFMPKTEIPYRYLQLVNGNMKLDLQKIIVAPNVVLNNVQADFALQNGLLKTNIKNINAGKGKISGTVDVDAKNQKAKANLKGTNIVLQDLYTAWSKADNKDLYIKKGGQINALINLETKGRHSDDYLRNLNGQIIFLADKSVLHVKSLERLQGNIIVQILQNLKFNVSKKEMNLRCAVVRSDIQNGRMNFPKGIVLNATDIYFVANGHINLSSEKINLAIQSFSGNISDISISSVLGAFLEIKGTLAHPQLSINKDTTAKSVIGAVATGGIYNVGDMMLSANHAPCHTALEGTVYADHFKADKSLRNSVSQGYNNTQDTVKDVVKGITKGTKKLKNNIKKLFQ